MIIESKVVGGAAEVVDRTIALGAGQQTLRGLLAELVRIEVREYETRRGEARLLRVLTPADLAVAPSSGRVRSGSRTVAAPPPEHVAIDRAIEAFQDELYFVFLDGAAMTDLDAAVVLTAETRVRLIRLVALAGG